MASNPETTNEYVDRLDQVKVTNFIRTKYTINKAKLYMFKKEKQKTAWKKVLRHI